MEEKIICSHCGATICVSDTYGDEYGCFHVIHSLYNAYNDSEVRQDEN